MPVIIQEIHITAEVDNTLNQPPPQSSSGSTGQAPMLPANIIAICVEEVLRIIHEKEQR